MCQAKEKQQRAMRDKEKRDEAAAATEKLQRAEALAFDAARTFPSSHTVPPPLQAPPAAPYLTIQHPRPSAPASALKEGRAVAARACSGRRRRRRGPLRARERAGWAGPRS